MAAAAEARGRAMLFPEYNWSGKDFGGDWKVLLCGTLGPNANPRPAEPLPKNAPPESLRARIPRSFGSRDCWQIHGINFLDAFHQLRWR